MGELCAVEETDKSLFRLIWPVTPFCHTDTKCLLYSCEGNWDEFDFILLDTNFNRPYMTTVKYLFSFNFNRFCQYEIPDSWNGSLLWYLHIYDSMPLLYKKKMSGKYSLILCRLYWASNTSFWMLNYHFFCSCVWSETMMCILARLGLCSPLGLFAYLGCLGVNDRMTGFP